MDLFEVTFLPQGKVVLARSGMTVFEAARAAGVDVETSCNGEGTCGKCRVQQVEGHAGAAGQDEKGHLSAGDLADGIRLACRCKIDGGATFRVLADSRRTQRILVDGFMPHFDFDPNVTKVHLRPSPPSLTESSSDLAGLRRQVGRSVSGQTSVAALRQFRGALRQGDGAVTLVFAGDALIAVEPGDTTGACYGLAVDIGTTTLVVSLVDLVGGEEVASASTVNPQSSYGLDVLTRIHHIRGNPADLDLLKTLVREAINGLIGKVCRRANVERRHVYEVAVAGNATMMHIFLSVDPAGMGRSPYTPVFTSAISVEAKDVGLDIADVGLIWCLPSVSAYVGADIVAGLVTAELDSSDKMSLLIDIGTNGEIVLKSAGRLFACSCAAGPAFEGMNISSGMRAARGAIEWVEIDDDVELVTIGDAPPTGICGSGVIDAVAELVKVGAVDHSGRFVDPAAAGAAGWVSRLSKNGRAGRFVLSGEPDSQIAVTQRDVRQVQLAKGAILSGVLALTRELGVALEEIERIYVAGAFGHHVRLESLARLGVLPTACLDRVTLIGNSSKTGALLCLLSKAKREEAESLAGRISYVELSCYPDFDRLFTRCLTFSEDRHGAPECC